MFAIGAAEEGTKGIEQRAFKTLAAGAGQSRAVFRTDAIDLDLVQLVDVAIGDQRQDGDVEEGEAEIGRHQIAA